MIANLHGIVRQLASTDSARRLDDASGGDDAVPSNADGMGAALRAILLRSRESMKISSQVHVFPNDRLTRQGDVWSSADVGLTPYFVASILRSALVRVVSQ